MKTFLKSTLSALLLSALVTISLPGLAQDEVPSTKTFAATMFPAADASKLWLHLEKYNTQEKVSVELYNEQGKLLYSGFLPKKSKKRNCYRQQFDMSQITDGKYTFRVTGGTQTQEMTFKLTTPTLTEALPNRLISMN